ncbi:MAG: DUF4214 domain-containing protein [Lachnospiraceae bacterium]|nr:DUF4214 domain-containing protein [Lachnospiraceae bacterium]
MPVKAKKKNIEEILNKYVVLWSNKAVAVILAIAMMLCGAGAVEASVRKDAFGKSVQADAVDAPVQAEVIVDVAAEVDTGRPKTGLFTQTVKVGPVTRSVKVYIPEGAVQGLYFTVIAPPEDVLAKDFIEEYGWKSYADEHKEGLLVLEPGKRGWNRPEDEQRYIEAVFSKLLDNGDFSTFGYFYLAGYGSAGSALQMYAMAHPDMMIGASFVGVCDISDRYIDSLSSSDVTTANTSNAADVTDATDGSDAVNVGYAADAAQAIDAADAMPTAYATDAASTANTIDAANTTDAMYAENAANATGATSSSMKNRCLPILLYDEGADERTEAVAEYWIGACDAELVLDNTSKSCHVRTYAGRSSGLTSSTEAMGVADVSIPISVFTDCSEDFIKGAVIKGQESVLRKLTRGSYFSEHDGRLQKRMDFDDDCDIFPIKIDGVTHEYIVYIPDSVKYSGKLSPVLYIFGDYTEPGNVLLEKLSLWRFAEERATIVVVPCDAYLPEDAMSGGEGTAAETAPDVSETRYLSESSSVSVVGSNARESEFGQLVSMIRAHVDEAYPVDPLRSLVAVYKTVPAEDTAYSTNLDISSILPEEADAILLSDWSQFPAKYEEAARAILEKTHAESPYKEELPPGTADEEGVRGFVERLYTSFLGREAEAEGLDQWVDALTTGKGTASEAVSGFVFSVESQENPISSQDYIKALYDIIFQRSPENVEINDWMSVLGMGCTRKKILEGFLNSVEMKELCRELGIVAGTYYSDELIDKVPNVTSYVSGLYRQILHRQPTDTEAEIWVRHIVEGYPASKVAEKFFLSKECRWTLSSDFDFVSELYSVAYGTVPDKGTYSSWLRALREGTEREAVVAAIFGEEVVLP